MFMEKIKAIFIDYDWTLFDHKTHQIPSSTIASLKEAKNKGIKLFINSARSYYSLEQLNCFNLIDFDGFITQNGGTCFFKDSTIYNHSFNKTSINKILKYVQEKKISYQLITQKSSYIHVYDKKFVDEFYNTFYEPYPLNIDQYQDEEILSIHLFIDDSIDNEINELCKDLFVLRFSCSCLEITPFRFSKKDGIEALIKYFNYDKNELMTFGDEVNDISMFNVVKYGICMGNGDLEAKEKAYFVTTNIEDDGIQYALKYFNVI